MTKTHAQRVFSGVQPTGNLHLGNYLGAIRKFVDMQHEMESIYCIVDMHAITVWQDPKQLRDQTLEIAAAYVAAGIDPDKAIIFQQSAVSGHAELAWVFNCVARMGWLNRMTQFKDKAGKDKERASVGLFVYPNLMAADILLYRATHVPVGEDQKQHLELARDIATKFNNEFGDEDFFPLPEPLIKGPGARIMSLRDGTSKMSKSDPSDLSRIVLTDDADTIAKKIKKAKTDPEPLPTEMDGLEDRPEAKNLVGIYAALAGMTDEAVLAEFGGEGFGKFKPALADLAVAKLAPLTEEMRRLRGDEAYLEGILRTGAEKARVIAEPIMREVKERVGFIV
ncbi:tryptophan--tRNA ligase [Parvularcula sp. LCG005]|uniref:tryptophan--tRNA ligase n=1 Tax=Parvularcula sp. LCG005 TaxID=3078805 RepID=UPI002942DD51|nr:tryptophan--tRNA ligase [Parvularcula sp. LCG005]WOI52887.1 tryptophan--tRNA ligase [Parvularcula sp. LCG005]